MTPGQEWAYLTTGDPLLTLLMFFLGTTSKTAMIDTMKAKYLTPANLGIQCFQIDIPKR